MSAFALKRLFNRIAEDARVDIFIPGGMSALTKKLLEIFPLEQAPDGGDYDLLIAVDVGDPELLDDWKQKMKEATGFKLLVDHHPKQIPSIYDKEVLDTAACSTSEIVYGLYRDSGVRPDNDAAQALLVGILFDSQHLRIAGEKTLRTVVDLLDCGADLASAKGMLSERPNYGEIVANFKGRQRSKVYRIDTWLIATSHIGSFHAGVARSLIGLGADVALVVGEVDNETILSLRASSRFFEKTHLDLGVDIAQTLAQEFGGHGGGHPTAATFSTSASEDEVLSYTMRRVATLLGSNSIEIK
jgi:nanoRNase/pAp phosphatase (c-di-AMP/oligoRNAs hydrolase)